MASSLELVARDRANVRIALGTRSRTVRNVQANGRLTLIVVDERLGALHQGRRPRSSPPPSPRRPDHAKFNLRVDSVLEDIAADYEHARITSGIRIERDRRSRPRPAHCSTSCSPTKAAPHSGLALDSARRTDSGTSHSARTSHRRTFALRTSHSHSALYDDQVFLKRKTEGSVLCASCGVLVGVNDETLLQLRPPESGPVGLRAGAPQPRAGSRLRAAGHGRHDHAVRRLGAALGRRHADADALAVAQQILFLLGASGAVPVFGYGRWWTLLTAGWLHAGVLHIFFNVLWVRQLAPAIAELFGPARMVIIYVVSGVTGFALSSVGRHVSRVDADPVSARRIDHGRRVGVDLRTARRRRLLRPAHGSSHAARAGLQYALVMGLFGLIFPGVDNYAHAGGFAGGYLAGLLLDPLKTERVDHMLIALGLPGRDAHRDRRVRRHGAAAICSRSECA